MTFCFRYAAALFGAAVVFSPRVMAQVPVSFDVNQTIGISGAVPKLDDIAVTSPHVYDYTFSSAPTDWRIQSGIWAMTNRWSCAPGWSWFGGWSDEVAAIWNKRKFSGDVSVQFYFGFKMESSGTFNRFTGEYRWWEYPADAGITIGGDGTNLSSGYSFVIGANDNQHTMLMRGSEVVADTRAPEALLSDYVDGTEDMDNRVHRRWWYARIDKIGSRVLCYLDNKLLFSYDDPEPLGAGKIALWTYKNGIMLSRVQIYYQQEISAKYQRFAAEPGPARKAASRLAQPAPARHTIAASPPRTNSTRRVALQP